MTRFDSPDWSYRRHGPAVTSAGDGMVGVYSAILHTVPSGGLCKVLIPAFSLTHYRTANCPAIFSGAIGDSVLVAFDDDKEPWVVVPSTIKDGLFLQLATTGTKRQVAMGSVTATFSAAANTAAVVVTHGLGVLPTLELTASSTSSGRSDVFATWLAGTKTTSQVQVLAFLGNQSSVTSGTATIDWVAIG